MRRKVNCGAHVPLQNISTWPPARLMQTLAEPVRYILIDWMLNTVSALSPCKLLLREKKRFTYCSCFSGICPTSGKVIFTQMQTIVYLTHKGKIQWYLHSELCTCEAAMSLSLLTADVHCPYCLLYSLSANWLDLIFDWLSQTAGDRLSWICMFSLYEYSAARLCGEIQTEHLANVPGQITFQLSTVVTVRDSKERITIACACGVRSLRS